MNRFAAPALAEAADRHLRGDGDAAEFAAAFDAAAADLGQAVHDIACDDAFRTALTWQNPAVLLAVDAIRRDGPQARATCAGGTGRRSSRSTGSGTA
ncbi:hypothetical protein V2I01_42790 [Micromonospora sp. BRA006-A]|nr:hypothetical protein [Micromonospora sp. BRA006-A]